MKIFAKIRLAVAQALVQAARALVPEGFEVSYEPAPDCRCRDCTSIRAARLVGEIVRESMLRERGGVIDLEKSISARGRASRKPN